MASSRSFRATRATRFPLSMPKPPRYCWSRNGSQRRERMSVTGSYQAGQQRPRIGEGRIGGFICAAIGLMSVGAVLCLRFPGVLTTPELRPHYDVELLRLVLATSMVIAAGLGVLSIALGGSRLRAAIGLSALLLAMLLGGP